MATTQKINMKAVIFAGGVGTRMWPISRERTPKQFEKIVGDKSTLQLTVERIRPEFDWQNIYISTGKQYTALIKKQLPFISSKNIIGEPEMRDVAPAVGFVAAIFAQKTPREPFVILWSDHLMKEVATFKKILRVGQRFIAKDSEKFLFLGQKARFANQNLGWIQLGKGIDRIDSFKIFEFKSWKYRPNIQLARQFFKSGKYVWNPGYWIVTPKFLLTQYKRFMLQMYKKLLVLGRAYGTKEEQKILKRIYPTFEKVSFDDAILEKLEPEKGAVLVADLGWSDVGTWQALKEALSKEKQDNITKGKVYLFQSEDSLVYNYTDELVAGIDLEGLVVVKTDDVLLVCQQESMPNIKKVVNQLKESKYKGYT